MKWLLKYNFEPCIEILKSYFRIDKCNVFNGTSNLYCSGLVCSASLAAWTPPTSSRSSPSSTRTGSISFRKIWKKSCNVQSNTAFPFFFAHILKNNLTKISWFFLQDDRVVAVGVCFSILDYSIYIPELILVRIQRSKQYCYIFHFDFCYSYTYRQKLAGRTPFLNKGGPILLFFGGNFLWWFYSTLPKWTIRFDGLLKRNFEGPRALNWYLPCLWVWAKIGKCKHLSELTKSTF